MHIALLKHQIQQAKNSLTGTPLSSDFMQIAVAGFLHESVSAGTSATQSKKRKRFIHSPATEGDQAFFTIQFPFLRTEPNQVRPPCGNSRYSLSFEVSQILRGSMRPCSRSFFLMIGFAGRFKPQPYIVQQGRLIFLRREVAARTTTPTRYSANARCVCSASAVIVPSAMLNASSIGATVLISFVRFRSSLPFTGSVPTFFGRSSVCCRVPPHSSRAPAALHCPQLRSASSCRPPRYFRANHRKRLCPTIPVIVKTKKQNVRHSMRYKF